MSPNLRENKIDMDLCVTSLLDAIRQYRKKSGGVSPTTLLVHSGLIDSAYEIKRGAGVAAELLYIVGVPGWWRADAWMLVGGDGYIIEEGC